MVRQNLGFYAFIALHVSIWTLAPALLRLTLPLDAMEGATWAKHIDFGYDKNPFMNAWVSALFIKFSQSDIAIYFLSQLSVIVCFWAVWQLGKKLLPPLAALTAVLLLEGIQYYNLHAIDFSDNSLELGMWALIILFFYRAITLNKLNDWLLTGLFAGLGMMTKYYTLLLLIPLFLLLLKDFRHYFKKPGLYFCLLIFITVITPHLIWLFTHDFITLNYVISRTVMESHWSNHIYFPLQFAIEQLETLLPVLILLLIFIPFAKAGQRAEREGTLQHSFLFFTGICPFLLTILLSVLFGIKLRAAWGQPLFSLWGIILIIWLKPDITPQKFYRFVAVLFTLVCIAVTVYCANLMRATTPSTAIFPGKDIAEHITQRWHEKYHTPLSYVAGGRWLVGNIAFYSSDHPEAYIDWKKTVNPWINETELLRHGAVFVWDLSVINRRKEVNFDDIKARFPTLTTIETVYFPWYRNKTLQPAEIRIAFLPPNN